MLGSIIQVLRLISLIATLLVRLMILADNIRETWRARHAKPAQAA